MRAAESELVRPCSSVTRPTGLNSRRTRGRSCSVPSPRSDRCARRFASPRTAHVPARGLLLPTGLLHYGHVRRWLPLGRGRAHARHPHVASSPILSESPPWLASDTASGTSPSMQSSLWLQAAFGSFGSSSGRCAAGKGLGGPVRATGSFGHARPTCPFRRKKHLEQSLRRELT